VKIAKRNGSGAKQTPSSKAARAPARATKLEAPLRIRVAQESRMVAERKERSLYFPHTAAFGITDEGR